MQPPETIQAGELVLRRWQPEWAEAAAKIIQESLPELAPFMPWATESYDLAASQGYVQRSTENWEKGTEYNYAIFTADAELIGSIGLMTRMGPGIIEIGYWLRTSHTGRGHMTAAVRAVTEVAHQIPGVDRVVIRHDAGNVASAAVAAKAGFVETSRGTREPEAPGETGVDVIRDHRA